MPAALSAAEGEALFAPLLGRHERLALAVSGGGDSLAMMWLVARWARGLRKAPELHVLTVDHGLQEDSAAVARSVCARAQELGLPCDILRWEGAKPDSGIEEAARVARYRLLGRWCAARSAALVVAHTLEDQAETFLMRLKRGAGVDGLAAMRPAGLVPHVPESVPLLRPLLSVPRARLRATLREVGWQWHEDPANADARHERARVRRLLDLLAQEGLRPAAIAASAARLQRAREALEREVAAFLAQEVALHRLGWAQVSAQALQEAAPEIALRVLAELIGRLGGHGKRLHNLAGLEQLFDWWRSGQERARTLGGAKLVRRQRALIIGREPGRIGAPLAVVAGAQEIVWDGRYLVRLEGLEGDVQLMALAQLGDVPQGAPARSDMVPAFVWQAQPAVVAGGKLVALPVIGWQASDAPFEAVEAQPLFSLPRS